MEQLLAPETLKDGNLGEGWIKFKREFEHFLLAIGKADANSRRKTAILLRVIGARGNDIYENFKLEGDERVDYDKVVRAFEDFCKPQDETFIARHRLLCMKQDGIPIEEFEIKLRTQARLGNLGDLTDDLTCHALVEGVDDKRLRDKLLMKACEGPLTLGTAVKVAREHTTASAHMKELGNELGESVNKLYDKQSKRKQDKGDTAKIAECDFCGWEHRRGPSNCPAYKKKCNYCKRDNHFEQKCRKKRRMSQRMNVELWTQKMRYIMQAIMNCW